MSPLQPIATPLAAPPKDPRQQLTKVAQQFEAIFVRQMLAEARKSHFGDEDTLGGQGMKTFRQMQDDRYADIAAEQGSFGLAKMIEAQLQKTLQAQSPLLLAGGAGGGPVSLPNASSGREETSPPLTPPASGRGTSDPGPAGEGV